MTPPGPATESKTSTMSSPTAAGSALRPTSGRYLPSERRARGETVLAMALRRRHRPYSAAIQCRLQAACARGSRQATRGSRRLPRLGFQLRRDRRGQLSIVDRRRARRFEGPPNAYPYDHCSMASPGSSGRRRCGSCASTIRSFLRDRLISDRSGDARGGASRGFICRPPRGPRTRGPDEPRRPAWPLAREGLTSNSRPDLVEPGDEPQGYHV